MTPFTQALLALEIAVDALHDVAKHSPESRRTAEDALAQINHFGFDARPAEDRKPEHHTAKVRASRRPKRQQSLFS